MTILTVPQAAIELGVSDDTVTRWIRGEHLPAKKVGKTWAITTEALKEFRRPKPAPRKARQFSGGRVKITNQTAFEVNSQRVTDALMECKAYTYIPHEGKRETRRRHAKN